MGEKTNTPVDKLDEYMKKHGDIIVNGSAVSSQDKTLEAGEHISMNGALEIVGDGSIKIKLSDAKAGEKIPVENGNKPAGKEAKSSGKDNSEGR